MTKDEALELALEAWQTSVYGSESHHKAMLLAMTNMALALAAPVQGPVKVWCETCEGTRAVYQEHQKGCCVGGEHSCPDCDGNGYYTTPPVAQRQWVGLSPLDRGECLSAGDAHGWIGVMEATEAKLKEKNA